MKNNDKTSEQLLEELEKSNKRIAELEKSEVWYMKTEEALKKSEEQFRLITENTSDLITLNTLDLKAFYTYVSPSIKAMSGHEPVDLLGRSAFEFIHPDDKRNLFPLLKKYVNLKIKKLLSGKELPLNETIEYRTKDKSGNWHFFQSTGNIIGDQFMFVTRDITERKKAEQKLEELNQAIEQSIEGIGIANLDGKFIFVNSAWAVMHGYRSADLIGKPASMLDSPEDRKNFPKVWEVIKKKGFWRGEIQRVRKDGSSFPVIMTSSLVLDDKKRPIGIIGVCLDITERKKAEEELQKRLKELEVYYQATLGREGRIIELKQEINKLLEQFGEKRKYGV